MPRHYPPLATLHARTSRDLCAKRHTSGSPTGSNPAGARGGSNDRTVTLVGRRGDRTESSVNPDRRNRRRGSRLYRSDRRSSPLSRQPAFGWRSSLRASPCRRDLGHGGVDLRDFGSRPQLPARHHAGRPAGLPHAAAPSGDAESEREKELRSAVHARSRAPASEKEKGSACGTALCSKRHPAVARCHQTSQSLNAVSEKAARAKRQPQRPRLGPTQGGRVERPCEGANHRTLSLRCAAPSMGHPLLRPRLWDRRSNRIRSVGRRRLHATLTAHLLRLSPEKSPPPPRACFEA